MPIAPAAQSAKEYARLLLRLHDLISQGEGDGEEADAIRDEMDEPWYAMTEREHERLSGLSEDLYSIANHDLKPVPMPAKEKEAWVAGYLRARETGDLDQLLASIRHPSLEVPRAMIRFTQAKCWEQFAEPNIALRFYRDAQRLDPIHGTFILMLLMREERWEDGVREAKQVIADAQSGPCELFMAASVLLLADHRAIEPQKSKLSVEQATQALERSIASVQSAPLWLQKVLRFKAICSLGIGYARLGNLDRAIDLYTKELARNPANADFLVLRGSLNGLRDQSAAQRDFDSAVRLGTKSVWPYYFLAHDVLVRGDYLRCHDLALTAISLKAWPRVLAQLHEWMGICRAATRYPEVYVRESFDKAEALDPGNDRIRRSRTIAESVLRKLEPLSEGHHWPSPGSEEFGAAMDDFVSQQADGFTASLSQEESDRLVAV